MPARLPLPHCLKYLKASQPASYSRNFTSTPSTQASTVAQRRRNRDPWAIAQSKAKKAANLSRQEVLKKERVEAAGDHVRGTLTPLVQSFDTALPSEPDENERLNFYLTPREFKQGIEYSRRISTPQTRWDSLLEEQQKSTGSSAATEQTSASKSWEDPGRRQEKDYVPDPPDMAQTDNLLLQATASEAVRRITSISCGNSKDRLRVNKARLINTFGRHSTDAKLPPPLRVPLRASIQDKSKEAGNLLQPERAPRVGPDTGSSEVQIAILTAKIKTVADFLERRGKRDKHGKRNLRLLVHRRAKMMKYLRRKERGGPRWQNVVEKLGLTDAMWQGEITM